MTDKLNEHFDLKISNLKIEDVVDVLNIAGECQLAEWSAEGLASEIKRADSLGLIARHHGIAIGFLHARLVAESELDILNFVVLEKYRKQGIGSTLWNRMVRTASKKFVKSVWLEVRESNLSAVKFYESKGFAVVQTRKNFYALPADNALLMKSVIEKSAFKVCAAT